MGATRSCRFRKAIRSIGPSACMRRPSVPTNRWRTSIRGNSVCPQPDSDFSPCMARGGGRIWRRLDSPRRSRGPSRSMCITTATCDETSRTSTISEGRSSSARPRRQRRTPTACRIAFTTSAITGRSHCCDYRGTRSALGRKAEDAEEIVTDADGRRKGDVRGYFRFVSRLRRRVRRWKPDVGLPRLSVQWYQECCSCR